MARVHYDQVTKSFGPAAIAIRDLTLDAADGELLVMLGPSGSGKTTALRLLAGLEHPDSGDIFIDGQSVVSLEPRERDVALVFQQFALYPHMKVRDNLLYPLKMRRLSGAERVQRVEEAAELLHITHLLDRKPAQLSGGERQRVALGRAIVRQPRVFLMDEPLSNLDEKLRLRTRAELKSLQKRLGVTTLFVTHDQAEAMSMADRIAVLCEGQLQQLAIPDRLYHYPANLFVAQFVGSPPMNVLSAVRQGDDLVTEGGWHVPAPPLSDSSLPPTLKVGLRPEAIQLSLEQGPARQPAEVSLSELFGSEVIVHVKVGPALVKVRATPDLRPRPGQVVYLSPAAQGVRLFNAATGRALGQ